MSLLFGTLSLTKAIFSEANIQWSGGSVRVEEIPQSVVQGSFGTDSVRVGI
jgi:hypothetical protein